MIIFLPFYYQQLLFFFSYWEKNSPTGKTKHLFILLFLNDYTIQKKGCLTTSNIPFTFFIPDHFK